MTSRSPKFGFQRWWEEYVKKEIFFPPGDPHDLIKQHIGTATKHLCDNNGIPIGSAKKNPLLDTREIKVKFADGHVESLTATIIVYTLLAEVEHEDQDLFYLMRSINHHKDNTVVRKRH